MVFLVISLTYRTLLKTYVFFFGQIFFTWLNYRTIFSCIKMAPIARELDKYHFMFTMS